MALWASGRVMVQDPVPLLGELTLRYVVLHYVCLDLKVILGPPWYPIRCDGSVVGVIGEGVVTANGNQPARSRWRRWLPLAVVGAAGCRWRVGGGLGHVGGVRERTQKNAEFDYHRHHHHHHGRRRREEEQEEI